MISLFYSFPAIRGKQAGDEYFTCMVPLGLLGRLLSDSEEEVPPEYRAQRRLNESRIPVIKRYILNNRDTYVFSALAASVDGVYEFCESEIDSSVGVLKISLDSTLVLNDGQHRKAAILSAIEEDPTLKEETIAIVLFKDKGLARSQQMFSDLNQHAVTTSKSLNALYDSKDVAALLGKAIVSEISFFKKYTDKEKDNLGKFSHMLFTLNNFVNSTRKFSSKIGDTFSIEEAKNYLIRFWNLVVANITEWNELEARELSKRDLREHFIVTQGVVILAFGQLADYCFESNVSLEETLPGLSEIDWSRSNEKDWMGCAIKSNGKINRTSRGIVLTYLRIKQLIGLPLKKSEKAELKKGN